MILRSDTKQDRHPGSSCSIVERPKQAFAMLQLNTVRRGFPLWSLPIIHASQDFLLQEVFEEPTEMETNFRMLQPRDLSKGKSLFDGAQLLLHETWDEGPLSAFLDPLLSC